MEITTEFPSIKKLLNTEFAIRYHDEKYELGEPGPGGPPDNYDIIIGRNTTFGFDEEIDFWDFDISLNEYTLKSAANNYYKIEYVKHLAGIFNSFKKEINLLRKEHEDTNQQALVLKDIQLELGAFEAEYYEVTIDSEAPRIVGLMHNSVKIIPNDQKKHKDDLAFIAFVVSEFLSQQKEYLQKTLDLLKQHIDNISEHNHLEHNSTVELSPDIEWKRSSTDLLELIVALQETNSLVYKRGSNSRKRLVETFEKLFSLEIKNAESMLTRATERKKDSSPYLTELQLSFDNYCKRKLERKE